MFSYPSTPKAEVEDSYFGLTVPDPYRWLEDDCSPETSDWVKRQNSYTQSYLESIPYRNAIRKKMEQAWSYPRVGIPQQVGHFLFFFKNDGLQNQSILYRQDGVEGTPAVFFDPNLLSADGTTSLVGISFSYDDRYVAYSLSDAGSDWVTIRVAEVSSGALLPDAIRWVKFSGAAWYGNGFFYSCFEEPSVGKELSSANSFQRVFYHTIGEDQCNDKLVFEDLSHPRRYYFPQVTEDQSSLLISVSEGTHGTELLYKDLRSEGELRVVLQGFDHNYAVVDEYGSKLVVLTNDGAPNGRVVLVDPSNPDRDRWEVLIPESQELLEELTCCGGSLFARYLKDAASYVVQYSYAGNRLGKVKLPGMGYALGFSGRRGDNAVFYSYTSFTDPTSIYYFDLQVEKSVLFFSPDQQEAYSEMVTTQLFYASKDGTRVPLFLVHKKGVVLNGENPVLLYGYGGFNICLTPSYSPSRMVFLESGGVYAVANLRGGGEYGEEWHRAGMLQNKQNVFDDFIAAAEHLIAEGYTSPSKLAISGGSNGGLLVGAAMVQRPELFRVAIPVVGVLDMLRYHLFTIGWGWIVEYGCSDNEHQLRYLVKYSPLHNINDGVMYPATLVMTADHDDRVVPAHSFKFAATLQSKGSNRNPYLIRIETNAGHGAGKSTSKLVDEATDMWAFVFYNLGMSPDL